MQLTTQKSARKTTDRQYRNVHLLLMHQEVFCNQAVVVLPQRINVVPDVTRAMLISSMTHLI